MGCDGRDVHVSMCVILGVNIGAASRGSGNRNRVARVCKMCEGMGVQGGGGSRGGGEGRGEGGTKAGLSQ